MTKFQTSVQPSLCVSLILTACIATGVQAVPVLGSAQAFSVLGASTVTNTGATTLVGDLGVFAGTAITGAQILCGRAIALHAAVTMDHNTISTACPADASTGGGGTVPEPAGPALVALALAALAGARPWV